MTLTSCCCSPCQPRAGEAAEGRVSVHEPGGPVHSDTRLGPEQGLQDWGSSKWKLGAQVLPHRWPSGWGYRHRTAPNFPIQNAASAGGGSGSDEEVLTGHAAGGLQLPVAGALLLLKDLPLVWSGPSLDAAACYRPRSRLLTEERVGGHVAGGIPVARFPPILLLVVRVGVCASARAPRAERGAPLPEVRVGLLGVWYGGKRWFPLAVWTKGWRGSLTACAVTTAAARFPSWVERRQSIS